MTAHILPVVTVKPARRLAGQNVSVITVEKSQNEKLGAVAATTVAIESCGSCPFKGHGCYAQQGPLGWMVGRMDKHVRENGLDYRDIARDEASAIDKMSGALPLRLHVAGDSSSNEAASIVSAAAERYSQRGGRPTWTYTHQWRSVDRSAWGQVSVLASVETAEDAQLAREKGYAPAMVVESFANGKRSWQLPTGATAIPCPEMTGSAASCADCRLCWNADALHRRNAVITFAVHGAQSKKAAAALK